MALLSEMFPMLPFAKEADRWLGILGKNADDPRMDIFRQLESRKIDEIIIVPIFSTAGMKSKRNGFHVVFNTRCHKKHAFFALGHEIAHTFHFDISQKPPVEIINSKSREFMYNFDDDGDPQGFYIEDFCDEFSKRWAAVNTKERMERWCADDNLISNILLMFSRWRE